MSKVLTNAEWLHDHLEDPKLIILHTTIKSIESKIDVEYQDKFIPGSIQFDLSRTFLNKNGTMPNTIPEASYFEEQCRKIGINKDSHIVIYDKLNVYASPRARWLFKVMGHDNVTILDGGFASWISANYTTVDSLTTECQMGNFEAKLIKEKVKYFQDIKSNIENNTFEIFDARSAGRFNGTATEPREGLQSGSIPNSNSLPYTDVIDNGYFKKPEALEKVFANVSTEGPLVFSCGSGITACIIMTAAELVMDNPMAIYDGSWTEYAELENLKK